MASGRVRVPARVEVSARATGLVVEVAAVEGRRVAPGDVLVRLDDAEARAAVDRAKAAEAAARARVEQLRRVGAVVAAQSVLQASTQLERA
ncbi:MAG TPA: biotin/lipoyl-binding protein, partial [Minicystis sp.]|nr:biotin/lipoyl-binding protein [Minicystis sp.]